MRPTRFEPTDPVAGDSRIEFSVESIRFGGEPLYASQLNRLRPELLDRPASDGARVRRRQLAQSLLLSENMVPTPYAAARRCAGVLGVTGTIEIYQAVGAENASLHLCNAPVLLEIQPQLLPLLDEPALCAAMGHELGHHLAHGAATPYAGVAEMVDQLLQTETGADDEVRQARLLSLSMELTADRFGLLACGRLEDALRLELASVTGLPVGQLSWGPQAYLDQCRHLTESRLDQGGGYLEHSLRVYALWLFSESEVYRQITGNGPGSRPLRDVDALLIRILSAAPGTAGLGNARAFEEPAIEVQECALTACVMMATADGRIDETEAGVIEQVFTPLVPQWRRLLDRDAAVTRFRELLPLMFRASARAQHGLFALLTHVLAADGVCQRAEIEQLMTIGQLIGCDGLFRLLLPSTIARSKLPVVLAQTPPSDRIPALDPAAPASAALPVFLDQVVARGGGRITLRRLLNLLGADRNSAEARRQLSQSLLDAGLAIDPALGESLNTRHWLSPSMTQATHGDPSTAPLRSGSSAAPRPPLHQTLTRLRDKLASGDDHSPSIRLSTARIGRAFDLHQLEALSTGLADRALQALDAGRPVNLLAGESGDESEAASHTRSALVALDREQRGRLEEAGANELFLGHPFLTGCINGYWVRAPLLLRPVVVRRQRQAVDLHTEPGSAAITNQALLRLLLRQKNVVFTDFLAQRMEEAMARGLDTLLEMLAAFDIGVRPTSAPLSALGERGTPISNGQGDGQDDHLEIENCAVLGLFPQSNSDLLHDYDDLLIQLGDGQAPAALLGCAGEILGADLKAEARPAATAVKSGLGAGITCVATDPAQASVLDQARDAAVLVIDGPPGTGKSQVIVNLVSEALLRGETVAVISEKRAALDAVLSRLDALGFRHLAAPVRDVNEDPQALYRQVAARLAVTTPWPYPKRPVEFLHAERAEIEDQLSRFAEPLAQRGADLSLGMAYTYFSGLDAPTLKTDASLARLDAVQAVALAETLHKMAPHAALLGADSPWTAPAGRPRRSRLRQLDADAIKAIDRQFVQLAQKRPEFDTARAAAGLSTAEDDARLAVAKAGLAAILASRPLRSAAVDRRRFFDLLSGRVPMVAVLAAATAAADAMATLESRTALTDDDRDHAAMVRARESLTSIRDAWRDAPSEVALATLCHCCRAVPEAALVTGQIEQAVAYWRQRIDAVRQARRRPQWADTPQLIAAVALIERGAGSGLPALSPDWWKAKRQLAQHLARWWPEMADAAVDRSLLDAIAQRRLAVEAWAALDALRAQIAIDQPADDADTAEALVRQIAAGAGGARNLLAARPQLEPLGWWPPPASAAQWPAWIQRIDADIAAESAIQRARQQIATLRTLLPDFDASPGLAAVQSLAQLARAVSAITAARPALAAIGAWPEASAATGDGDGWDQRVDRLTAVLRSRSALETGCGKLAHAFPWLEWTLPADDWARRARTWPDAAPGLIQCDELLEQALAIHPRAEALLQALVTAFVPADRWSDAVLKAWAAALIETLEPSTPTEALSQDTEDALAQRYREQEAQIGQTLAALALARQDENAWLRESFAADGARRSEIHAIKQGLLDEADKSRGQLSLRSYVRRYSSQGLLEAVPVWLLSPATLSHLFPLDTRFDLVVFDESSQCPVEHAVPVLIRARRAVIAGDERQMPPRNFFMTAVDDEESADAGPPAPQHADAESLLVLARSQVRHAALAWHYRCRQEELIAFSNHAIYEGRLQTIPSISSRRAVAAVRWHAVESDDGRGGEPAAEAATVVELLASLLDQPQPPTLGVITLNPSQRRAILDAIDRHREQHPAFAAAYDRACATHRVDERPFIKNLENVQGDERDVILFSLGHVPRSPNGQGLSTDDPRRPRLGLMGRPDGERGLNVAISRARQEIHVVASFEPAQLLVASNPNEGSRLFKGFVEYARAMAGGRRSEAERVLELMRSRESPPPARTVSALPSFLPLKTQLLLRLEREGLRCELDVGISEFRIELAVVDPADPDRYCLGLIFVDGQTQRSPAEAHLHIPMILGERGWKLLRVNARDWALQPDRVVGKILAAVPARHSSKT